VYWKYKFVRTESTCSVLQPCYIYAIQIVSMVTTVPSSCHSFLWSIGKCLRLDWNKSLHTKKCTCYDITVYKLIYNLYQADLLPEHRESARSKLLYHTDILQFDALPWLFSPVWSQHPTINQIVCLNLTKTLRHKDMSEYIYK